NDNPSHPVTGETGEYPSVEIKKKDNFLKKMKQKRLDKLYKRAELKKNMETIKKIQEDERRLIEQ
ncbi:MAG: hypothetical protein ACP5D2_03500, partial [Candidatus Nanoarchaeia archaeon]